MLTLKLHVHLIQQAILTNVMQAIHADYFGRQLADIVRIVENVIDLDMMYRNRLITQYGLTHE